MKKIFVLAALTTAIVVTGQNKLDVQSRAALSLYQTERSVLKSTTVLPKQVTAIVQLTDGDVSALEGKGVEILRQRGDMAIVRIPMDSVEAVAGLRTLEAMQFSRPEYARLDKAHLTTGVDKVKQGEGLDKVYTGDGVIVACVDVGIDPNHVTFRKAGTSESRVKRVWTANQGSMVAYDTSEKIAEFTTDTKNHTHGTHVMGIAAGSYLSSTVPYEGVASGADIAMVGLGQADDENDAEILLGIENLIDYAKQAGKPLVVNMSLGSNFGPHDGSSMTERYLERLGKEAIICVSAGNEGDEAVAAKHVFSADNPEMKGLFEGISAYGADTQTVSGNVGFWSLGSTEFTLKPVVVSTGGKILYEFDAVTGSAGGEKTYTSDTDTGMAQYVSGTMTVAWGLDENNKRYCATITFGRARMASRSYILGYVITSADGNTVYAYADGNNMMFHKLNGWADGIDGDGSINVLACANNVISVGAYLTRRSISFIDGGTIQETGTTGNVAKFSSYGTLVDGRSLPNVCAPGCITVSAYSTPYIDYMASSRSTALQDYNHVVAKEEVDGQYYFWSQMSGTSMSAPYVSGTVALWLEANPKLTYADVVDVINATSTIDKYVEKGNKVKWGAGKINAYEGLKKVIRDSGVGEVSADKNLLVRSLGDGRYEFFVGGESSVVVEAYDIAGRKVATAASDGDTVVLHLDGRQAGVYVVSVECLKSRYSKKIIVR